MIVTKVHLSRAVTEIIQTSIRILSFSLLLFGTHLFVHVRNPEVRRLPKPSPSIPASSSASLPLFQNSSIKVCIAYTRTYFIDLCTTVHFYLVSPFLRHANSPTMLAKAGMHITKRPTYQKLYLAKVGSYQCKEAWHWPAASRNTVSTVTQYSDYLSAAWPLHAIVHSRVQDKHRTPPRSGSSMQTG